MNWMNFFHDRFTRSEKSELGTFELLNLTTILLSFLTKEMKNSSLCARNK